MVTHSPLFRSFFLFWLFVVTLGVVFAGTLSRGQKVLSALSAGEVDSAFIFLEAAVQEGLPEDSLYYLWAEIYIARGSLDTALALSIAGQRIGDGPLTASLMTQRYNIYLALGLKKDADDLLDTIMKSTPPVKTVLPRILVNMGYGPNQRNSLERQPYPFINEISIPEEIPNKGLDLSLNSSWFLPLKNGVILVPGLGGSFTNGVERTEISRDSGNIALDLSLDLKNIWNRLSLGYQLQGRLNMYKDQSVVNTVSLSRSAINSAGILYSSLMYSIEVGEERDVLYQAIWLMNYLSRHLTSNIDLNIMPLVTCFLTDDLNSYYSTSVMYIEDPNADTVRHYTDASCTQLIPIPDPLSMLSQMQLIRDYRAASDIRTYAMNAPESYVGITPAAGLELSLPHGFSIEGTLKGMVNYYFKEHEWTTLSIPFSPFTYDSSSWLAYSHSDGNYYLVEELGNILTAERYSGPLDIQHHKRRRIDFMIGGELLLEYKLWKLGTVGLNGYLKKYHSTLQNDLPVKMKELFYGGGISFRIYFGAAQSLAAF
ncbi:MAG: hypothetical protein JW768_04450 [Chitinispirillaceae bacterium]|nr:hypothetical protein [Chitinispirillaceae bacterium]